MQLPKLPAAVLVAVAVAGYASFRNLTAAIAVGPNASGGFPGGLPGQTRGTRLPAPGSSVKLPNGYYASPGRFTSSAKACKQKVTCRPPPHRDTPSTGRPSPDSIDASRSFADSQQAR